MKPPAFFQTIRTRHAKAGQERRALMHDSAEAQSCAKRAIFALHRGDHAVAKKLLAEARALLTLVGKRVCRYPELDQEGAHRAAREEFAEAVLFAQYLSGKAFGKPESLCADPGVYLGGLSDTTGEIVRHAVRQATAGRFEEVKRAHAAVEMVVGFLLELDLTGYLRQKFDQAKRNLRVLEEMLYDVSVKRRTL